MKKSRAVIVVSIDGLCSLQTGVGSVVEGFIDGFHLFQNKLTKDNSLPISLHCLHPILLESAEGYRADIAKKTKARCKEFGGDAHEFPSLADGSCWGNLWFGEHITRAFEQWDVSSRQAAKLILKLSKDYHHVTVLAHDTIFARIGEEIGNQKSINVVWIPHSLGVIFKDDSQALKLQYEKDAVRSLIDVQHQIGFVSEHFKKLLHDQYQVPKSKLVSLLNGLNPNSSRTKIDPDLGRQFLTDHGIKKSDKIVFSWGRCKEQKGFDLLIPAIKALNESNSEQNIHLVLIMPIATTSPSYLNKIEKQISRISKNVTAIFEFDECLPFNLLSSGWIDTVVLASRFEAFGLVASEVLEFAHKYTQIVYSPIPPFQSIFANQETGLMAKSLSIKGLADVIQFSFTGQTENLVDRKFSGQSLICNYVHGLKETLEKQV